ncbi:23182_t:CDS:2 [Dentiscutata erythropus]|uniref:23182_t:CDS:1 n=1 Tax=Dentiscutata erythropus TaxID=1348616 RepID=A0A9N9C0J9_9GLOM|nr:23182_t:CDS:2 [Dentiscutata erythropus]
MLILLAGEDDLGDGTVGCGLRSDAVKLFIEFNWHWMNQVYSGIDFDLENKRFRKNEEEIRRRIMHRGKFLLAYSPIIIGEKELPCFFQNCFEALSICEKTFIRFSKRN